MNPDTKVTDAQLKAICARHNIPYRSHDRITTGFSHELHRINDDLVIKLFNAEDARHFKTEAALLSSNFPFLKPRLIASAEKNEDNDRSYIIMSYIDGISLGSNWHRASDQQRENLIKEICKSLKVINQINPSDIALAEGAAWDVSIDNRANKLLAKLQDQKIIDAVIAKKVRNTIAKNLPSLANTEMYPVYWDIHFDNFIVNNNFKLRALIDLENVELAALDYPIFVIQKQVEEPEKFLREEDEKHANVMDYERLKGWYQKYYPEMFDAPNLENRLRVYQILDTLHLLTDWSHVKELYAKLERLMAE